ncbi:MAG: hypothetical protein IT572_09640 [Deltaproteobacteria bacterium]|nr:hypothetical protein [Deltaproteobacteria bacterium]
MKYPIVPTRWTRLFFLVACLLGLNQCFSTFTIESQPWAEGEKLILNFEGPATVSYKLSDGSLVNIPVDKEETMKFLNVFPDARHHTVFFMELSDQELKLNVGLPRDLEAPSRGVATLFNQFKNHEITDYKNLNREDAILDAAVPVSIQGKFVNAETERKVAVCKDGAEVRDDVGSTPNLRCPITDRTEYTGETFKSAYTKDELMRKLNDEKKNLLGADPGIPIEVVVKNTQPAGAPGGNSSGGDSAQRGSGGLGGGAATGPAAGAEGKGGCSLATAPTGALDFGLLSALVAGLVGWLRLRPKP